MPHRLHNFPHGFVSYKWRVLLPTVGLLWVAMFGLAFYQHYNEVRLRKEMIRVQLDRVAEKVIDAYLQGVDLTSFVDFIDEFFSNTRYEGMRVSVYTFEGAPIHCCGKQIPFVLKDYRTDHLDDLPPEQQAQIKEVVSQLGKNVFYYTSRQSTDGKLYVLTAMPMTQILDNTMAQSNRIWFIVFPIMIVATIAVYLMVSYLTRSVSLLAEFADHAAEGKRFQDADKFPDNEFGRISRQIIRLYREKDKAMEEKLHEKQVALNAITEKMRFKRETTNNINHEIKTPLGIIKGYIDTILANPDMDRDAIMHFLTRAQTNVDRLASLHNDIATITRLEDGTTQINISPIDIHDLVYTLADEIETTGVYAPMKFHFTMPLNTVVRGNQSLILGVLHNFMRNALHHSKGTDMYFEFVGESATHYTFRFYDNGRGVPEESIAHLFERFYRVDKGRSRKSGDTGLGLPIVQSTIVALGGAISVKNRSTGGLEFIFSILKWQKPENSDPSAPQA